MFRAVRAVNAMRALPAQRHLLSEGVVSLEERDMKF
jgi:hypothetical protein